MPILDLRLPYIPTRWFLSCVGFHVPLRMLLLDKFFSDSFSIVKSCMMYKLMFKSLATSIAAEWFLAHVDFTCQGVH